MNCPSMPEVMMVCGSRLIGLGRSGFLYQLWNLRKTLPQSPLHPHRHRRQPIRQPIHQPALLRKPALLPGHQRRPTHQRPPTHQPQRITLAYQKMRQFGTPRQPYSWRYLMTIFRIGRTQIAILLLTMPIIWPVRPVTFHILHALIHCTIIYLMSFGIGEELVRQCGMET